MDKGIDGAECVSIQPLQHGDEEVESKEQNVRPYAIVCLCVHASCVFTSFVVVSCHVS